MDLTHPGDEISLMKPTLHSLLLIQMLNTQTGDNPADSGYMTYGMSRKNAELRGANDPQVNGDGFQMSFSIEKVM